MPISPRNSVCNQQRQTASGLPPPSCRSNASQLILNTGGSGGKGLSSTPIPTYLPTWHSPETSPSSGDICEAFWFSEACGSPLFPVAASPSGVTAAGLAYLGSAGLLSTSTLSVPRVLAKAWGAAKDCLTRRGYCGLSAAASVTLFWALCTLALPAQHPYCLALSCYCEGGGYWGALTVCPR